MVSSLVLDAGALLALDRNDRGVWAMLRIATDDARLVQVPAGATAQARRDGRRQVLLTRALRHCDEVDASVAIAAAGLARRGAVSVLTSDSGDIEHLVETLQVGVNVIGV
jgi:hypothetical protein